MHGDEPSLPSHSSAAYNAFPVCTGMNRVFLVYLAPLQSVPRMHGDEPLQPPLNSAWLQRSPYARG